MSDDIVTRLRMSGAGLFYNKLMREAADEIELQRQDAASWRQVAEGAHDECYEDLRERAERAEANRAYWKKLQHDIACDERNAAADRAQRAEQDAARLAEALRDLDSATIAHPGFGLIPVGALDEIRAALVAHDKETTE